MRKKQQPMKTYLVDLKLKRAVQVTLDECCNFRQFNGVHNFNSQKWIKLVNKSSLHSAICRTKIDMTKGKGLIYDSEGNQEAADFVQKISTICTPKNSRRILCPDVGSIQ